MISYKLLNLIDIVQSYLLNVNRSLLQGATATLDIDTERERDARTQFERVQKELEKGEEGEGARETDEVC